MLVIAHHELSKLQRLAKKEHQAHLRLRLQAVILARQGHSGKHIADMLGTSRRTVCSWIGSYNDHGVDGLSSRPHSGRPSLLVPEHMDRLRKRLQAGPQPQDGVHKLRGRDVQRILEQEFGVSYSLAGVYWLLHQLGHAPRPKSSSQAVYASS